ncbi:MAG: RnfABCDGE type electron transport complex subunit G [Gammaproteobacteria bacterium]|nr:RnfABCDGE type electron transport complex subunit G [Gammaproteobacteria bacterium]MBU1776893.1 RnfABCDGE type electron transport complex subunit G [Gammaproteobacteria bacterium]MBU1968732.1 RnfABCDGE type electron transport complex subunit G [Gammaproteobacteria bacterium]
MKLEELRGKLIYQALLVGAAALLTSALLSFFSQATEADIKAAEEADLKASLAQVLPGAYENDLLKDTVTLPGKEGEVLVYRGRRKGKVEAVVYQVSGNGYAGSIVCVMGVSREGKILGVRVIKHKETPGLGDKIEPAKGDWIHSFEGRWLGDPVTEKWAVKKDGGVFDQFAGATITPRGVVNAVKGGLAFFEGNKAQLLDEGVQP